MQFSFQIQRGATLILLLFFLLTKPTSADSSFAPSSPVVGILTQPRISTLTNETEYYIAASYVKWIELAGARAIPIPYDAPEELVDHLFAQINGLLFPGGGSDVPLAARRLWALANQDTADYFPIWGTCLGFEYLVQLASAQGSNVLQSGFDAENMSLPLHLNSDADSVLYRDAHIRSIVLSQNVTMNNHRMGVEPSRFMLDSQLSSMFVVTSTNVDRQGRPFVSTVEPRDPDTHPFYGVQYHPEKNAFEFGTVNGRPSQAVEAINHSDDAISLTEHLARFFGRLVRRNLKQVNPVHAYTDSERFPLVHEYEMKTGVKFEQVYLVPSPVAGSAIRV